MGSHLNPRSPKKIVTETYSKFWLTVITACFRYWLD